MRKVLISFMKIALLVVIALVSSNSFGQGLNQMTILPINPTSADTIRIVSDLSYTGNCEEGLVHLLVQESNGVIQIFPLYCGYFDTTICHSIDTFLVEPLMEGNYQIEIEYHQGSVCPISGFDAIIATLDTTLTVGQTNDIFSLGTSDKFSIYPNPSSDFIHFNINSRERLKRIQLLNIDGTEVKNILMEEWIDLRSLPAAIYVLKVQFTNGEIITKKVVKSDN